MRATYDNTMAALGFPQNPVFRAQVEKAVAETNEEADLAYIYIPLLRVIFDAYQQLCSETESLRVGDTRLVEFLEWFDQFETVHGEVALTQAMQKEDRYENYNKETDRKTVSRIFRLSSYGDRTLGWVEIDEVSTIEKATGLITQYLVDFTSI